MFILGVASGVLAVVLATAILLRARKMRRLLFAALLEQGRREAGSRAPYRLEQRVQAVQQRLSRSIGRKRAFSESTHRAIRKALGF